MNFLQKLYVKFFKVKGQKTTMINCIKCPKCGSFDTTRCHHQGNFALPECFYQSCDECNHQWDHS